ncbi:hypothetical protein M8C21_028224 [Ambrosia artemisiifolia]|uniref:Exocyst subunit Exo70 family protein n=1 Tax=Ambrosia artemisiifolia TaxID=4212 RepID=A0AAD5GQ48_AMBAR|nr:hypothetical protein M8C21_028224 [Ambrosia artemisiifolia]
MGLIDVHHPLALVFGILGNIISIGVYFAPIPTFIAICKNKSTMGFQSLPYVVSLFSALLWLYYALIKGGGNTFLLITINAFGSLVELVYVIIFIVYATPSAKKQTFKVLSATTTLCLAISLGSYYFVHGSTRTLVVGWIGVGLSICVFAAPLTIVCQVVKTKSVEFMPFPLSCLLTLCAMMWFAYGIFTKDLCVMVPNALGFILGLIQIALYKYYKQKGKLISFPEIKLPEHVINIKASNSEVYPVDSSRSSGSEMEAEDKTTEGAGGEVVERYKGAVTAMAMVDDDPCGVEVVNVKPTILIIRARNRRKSRSNHNSPNLHDDDVLDTIDNEYLSNVDHAQISTAIDSFIEELSTVDDKTISPVLPDTVDTFVKIIELNIKTYNSINSGIRFANITEEDEFFMDAIKRLSKLKIALGEFPNTPSLNTIWRVLQLAIVLLEDEFRAILLGSNAPSETITKGAEPESYNQEDFPGYTKENVILMNKIVTLMILAGYQYECCQSYSEIRKDELDDQIKRFEFDKVSIEDVHKSKWVSLEPDITRWVKLANHCSHVLFVEERKLGETIFSNHLTVFTSLFINLIRGITTSLLEFPTTLAIEKPKAKRLFKFLEIHESIRDLSIAVKESNSCDGKLEEYCNLKSEISIVGDTIGEVVINMFNDLKQTISNDTNKTTVQGAVHPLTRYVMGYIKCAFNDYENTLKHIFEQHVRLENKTSSDMENSYLSQHLLDMIELLDANLETKSTYYKDPSLRYIFLMNNNRFILQTVKQSNEMRQLMGDNWCRRKSSDVRNYHKSYQRETWTKLIQWLTQEGIQVNGKPSRHILKDRFKTFNTMFDEIHKTQSTWVVSDQQLLSEMRVSIIAVVSPAYRSFIGRYKPQFEGSKSIDRYIKYQPEDIESLIESLFEGTEKVETQLNAIQALSTVKQTTGAFKSLLKTYKNVGLM